MYQACCSVTANWRTQDSVDLHSLPHPEGQWQTQIATCMAYHSQRRGGRFNARAAIRQQPVVGQVVQLPLVLQGGPAEAAIVDAGLCEPCKGIRLVVAGLVV